VEIGVDGIEMEGDISEDTENIKQLLNKYNLKILSVTPKNVDISSLDSTIRENAIQYYINLLDWARNLEVTRIGYHGDLEKYKVRKMIVLIGSYL